jgi:AsmA protein
LVLLAAACWGILLSTFSPDDHARKISAVVEKATGRQLRFQDEISVSLFPTPSLKTGRLIMHDPGTFGGGAFITVEKASVALSVKPLLQGTLQIEEIFLEAPVLHLLTTEFGQSNWEYGFSSGKPQALSQEQAARAGDTPASSRSIPPNPSDSGTDSGGSTPLAEPARADTPKSGFFSRLEIQVERLTCNKAQVLYRNLRTRESWTGVLDSFAVHSIRRDADVPFSAAGNLTGEALKGKALFALKGVARLNSAGALSARVEAFDLEAVSPAAAPIVMKNRVEFVYDPTSRTLEMRSLQGTLGKAAYGGNLAVTLPAGKAPAQFTGDLTLSNLNVDALLEKTETVRSFAHTEEPKGAPNLTRPNVALVGGVTADRKASDNLPNNTASSPQQAQGFPSQESVAAPPSAGAQGTLAVTVSSLTLNALLIDKCTATLHLQDNMASIPFSLATLDGTVKGALRADLRKGIPALVFAAAVKALNMEKLSRVLSIKTTVSGALSADVEISGQGRSWKELAPTLKGKLSLLAHNGEVRNFALIPLNLRGIENAPVNFPFERISGSGKVERGILTSKDISLQAKLLTAAGGGIINLVLEQLDLGIDFMIAGNPPAIPVNITGPFSSVSSSVDIRTLMRNTAEGALTSPEKVKKLLKNAEKFLLR